jgi:hypothetical protein
MMMKLISREAFNYLRIFTAAYADHIHHDVLSSAKHSDMNSIGPRAKYDAMEIIIKCRDC